MFKDFIDLLKHILPMCKLKVVMLLSLTIILIIFETLGIASIIPIISLIIDYENIKINFSSVAKLIEYYDLSYEKTIYMSLSALFIIFFIKNIFIGYYNFKSNQIIQFIRYIISDKLFKNYFFLDYYNLTKDHSSTLLRNITSESQQAAAYVQNFIIFVSELTILVFLFSIMLYVEFLSSIYVGVFLLIVSSIYLLFFKNKLANLGHQDVYHKGKSIQHIIQGLNNMKIIQLMGKQYFFLKKYNSHSVQTLRILTMLRFFSGLSKPIFEMLIIIGITFLIYLLIQTGASKEKIIFTIGVYGTIMFRAIPGITKVMSGFQLMKYLQPSLKIIIGEILKKPKNNILINKSVESKNLKFEELSLNKISFNYGEKKILDKVEFNLKKNDIVGILGKSGEGKSTLTDIIMGFLNPSEGEVVINNEKNFKKNNNWFKLFGYVPQNFYLMDDTIENNICFGLEPKEINKETLKKIIEICQIKNIFKNNYSTNYKIGENGAELSEGQRQRIALARALYADPQILILDEATSSLDLKTEEMIISTLRKMIGFKTMIIISHRLSTLNICNKIYELKNKSLTKVK